MPIYTIDDAYGDERQGSPNDTLPVYLPPSSQVNQWDVPGGTCPQCTGGAHFITPLNPSRVHSGTWHTVTMNPGEPLTTLTITFTGTWVEAYCLLPPYLGTYITSSMNLTFILDDSVVGQYERATSLDKDWTYNASVFTSSQLENKQHTLVIEPQPGMNSSFLAFDYAAYEFVEPSTSTTPDSPSSPTPPPPPVLTIRSTSGSSTTISTTAVVVPPAQSSPVSSGSGSTASSELVNSPSSALGDSGSGPSTSFSAAPTTQSSFSVTTIISTGFALPTSLSDSAAQKPLSHLGAIIGGIVGSVAFLLISLFLLRYFRRRMRDIRPRDGFVSKPEAMLDPDPFASPSLPLTSTPDPAHDVVAPFISVRFDSSSQCINEDIPVDMRRNQHEKERQAQLQRRREELEEQLSSVDDEGSDAAVVAGLRRELETMRALVMELQNAAFDEPPPSYMSETSGAGSTAETREEL